MHELRGVAASAARLVREHQRSQQRAVSRRLLTVLWVYRITGHMGWCMMAATALGIAELYVAGTGTEASPPLPELPALGADVWEPRAARLLILWPVPLPVEKAGRLIAELRVLGFLAEANARGVAVSTPHLAALLRKAWPLWHWAIEPESSSCACVICHGSGKPRPDNSVCDGTCGGGDCL